MSEKRKKRKSNKKKKREGQIGMEMPIMLAGLELTEADVKRSREVAIRA